MMKFAFNFKTASCIALSVFVLSGCSDVPHQDLRQWMTEQENAVSPVIKAIDEPKAFVPQVYDSLGSTEPFNKNKLLDVLKAQIADDSNSSALLEIEQNRRKQPLESYPLDSIAFVGYLQKSGTPTALLRVNGLIYQVKTGDYLGQNYGLIKDLGESEILIREIVQDTLGEWVEQDISLYLQESDDE